MVYKLRAAKLTLVSSVRTVFLNFPASFICFPASLVWLSGVSQMALYHKVDLNCSEKLLKALLCKGLQPHLHFLSFWKAFFFLCWLLFHTLCRNGGNLTNGGENKTLIRKCSCHKAILKDEFSNTEKDQGMTNPTKTELKISGSWSYIVMNPIFNSNHHRHIWTKSAER